MEKLKHHPILNMLQLMRIPHYLKNGLIFLPAVFAGEFFHLPVLHACLLGFISFSLLSSAVYIINDIRDIESDRMHDVKKNRPLASGAVSITQAVLLAGILFLFSIIFHDIAVGVDIYSGFLLFAYLGLNILYSWGFKNIPLVDVVLLVSGFLLRILYGGAITWLDVSSWMYLTVIAMSFYLSLGKRRNEIKKQGNNARKVLAYYTSSFLEKNMYMCLAVTIVFYSLWCVDQSTIAARLGGNLLWTVPLVMLICMKYSMNIEGDSFGDPVDIVIHDKALLSLIGFYCLEVFFSIYGSAIFYFLTGR